MSIESRLREEMQESGDRPNAPVGVVDRMLRTARRRRRRRRAGATLGALAAVTAATVIPLSLHRSDAVPAHRSSNVIGAYTAYGSGQSYDSRILDPASGKYVPLPTVDGHEVLDLRFSPDGSKVVFVVAGRSGYLALSSTVALASGHLRKPTVIPYAAGRPTKDAMWSSDGKRILVPYTGDVTNDSAQGGFSIYDVKTHTAGPLVKLRLHASETVVTWGRSDNEVAVGHDPANTSRSPQTKIIRFFDLSGHSRGQVTVPSSGFDRPDLMISTFGLHQFSPDGQYFEQAQGAVFDLKTGHTIHSQVSFKNCVYVRNIGWTKDGRYLECATAQHPKIYLERTNGTVERTIPLPEGTPGMPVRINGQLQSILVTLSGSHAYRPASGIHL